MDMDRKSNEKCFFLLLTLFVLFPVMSIVFVIAKLTFVVALFLHFVDERINELEIKNPDIKKLYDGTHIIYIAMKDKFCCFKNNVEKEHQSQKLLTQAETTSKIGMKNECFACVGILFLFFALLGYIASIFFAYYIVINYTAALDLQTNPILIIIIVLVCVFFYLGVKQMSALTSIYKEKDSQGATAKV